MVLRTLWSGHALGNDAAREAVLQKLQYHRPMHLDDIALYVRIVELGTLSAAAREKVEGLYLFMLREQRRAR